MKAAGIKELKTALEQRSPQELVQFCLHLARFKKDAKEYLSYLLFEAQDIESYRASVVEYIQGEFSELNTNNYYYIRKSARKILTQTKKYIRYAKDKETEVLLLCTYCQALREVEPSIFESPRLTNIYDTQLRMAKKALASLHEDLQFDYTSEFDYLWEQ